MPGAVLLLAPEAHLRCRRRTASLLFSLLGVFCAGKFRAAEYFSTVFNVLSEGLSAVFEELISHCAHVCEHWTGTGTGTGACTSSMYQTCESNTVIMTKCAYKTSVIHLAPKQAKEPNVFRIM